MEFSNKLLHRLFAACWDELVDHGMFDDRGGAQYRRLRAEWVHDGRPVRIMEWLRDAHKRDVQPLG